MVRKILMTFFLIFFTPWLYGVETLTTRQMPLAYQLPIPQETTTSADENSCNPESSKKEVRSLINTAFDYMGMKYAFGAGKGGARTDCSLFAQRVFSKFGVHLPRSASQQAHLGKHVSLQHIQPGDLLFYRTYKKAPSHVAIYIGNGKIIHASFRQRKVTVDSIALPYYKKRFLFAKRVALKKEG